MSVYRGHNFAHFVLKRFDLGLLEPYSSGSHVHVPPDSFKPTCFRRQRAKRFCRHLCRFQHLSFKVLKITVILWQMAVPFSFEMLWKLLFLVMRCVSTLILLN